MDESRRGLSAFIGTAASEVAYLTKVLDASCPLTTVSGLHHDFGDAEPAMSADWSSQSELRIAKASGSARAVNVVSLTSDMTSLKNKVCPRIQGINSISDEYLTPN